MYTYIHIHTYIYISHKKCVAVCCSVLQCAAVCCSVLQCVAVGLTGVCVTIKAS